ncbi:hypothetical protein NG2371_01171 [Nocardia gamkensis]|nr:hypothetical protein [Nocardia gamkensis]
MQVTAASATLRAGVVDDIGLLPVSPDAAEGLFRLVDPAYERRALAVTSNLHPSGFYEITPKTLAAATVDRLLHHPHVVVTDRDSYRLAQATTGQRRSHCADLGGEIAGHLRGRFPAAVRLPATLPALQSLSRGKHVVAESVA